MRSIILLLILSQATWSFADDSAEQTGSDPHTPPPDQEMLTSDPAASHENIDALFTLYQPYLDNISAYQPIYFLVGTDPGDSTFQFSFKYRLFDIESDKSEKMGLLNGFHFAYTQTSYWDLAADSLPFEDTSYKPAPAFWNQVTNLRGSSPLISFREKNSHLQE